MDKITNNKILVDKLPSEANKHDIKQYFSKFGEIKNITIALDQLTGNPKRFCCIEFYFHASVAESLRRKSYNFMGGGGGGGKDFC
jgi:RNA recognition motif-containing protein